MKRFAFLLTLMILLPCTLKAAESWPEIRIYIHVCTINQWEEVLERQLTLIETSGLYKRCQSIHLGVLGVGDLSPFIARFPKISILFQNPEIALYERPTLLKLHQRCRGKNNLKVLYLHTKGVSRAFHPIVTPNIFDWACYMEYFLIERWRDCIEALKEHDVCGVNWRSAPSPHFSGNFWWASSKYVATLPDTIGSKYLDPEMWIGLKAPKVRCFHESRVDHYSKPYPPSQYRTQ